MTEEIIGYTAAFLTTISFLPQAIITIKTRNTDSLSLSMYALFTIGVFLWLIYGYYREDFAIIIANTITFMLSSLILYVKIINSLNTSKA